MTTQTTTSTKIQNVNTKNQNTRDNLQTQFRNELLDEVALKRNSAGFDLDKCKTLFCNAKIDACLKEARLWVVKMNKPRANYYIAQAHIWAEFMGIDITRQIKYTWRQNPEGVFASVC